MLLILQGDESMSRARIQSRAIMLLERISSDQKEAPMGTRNEDVETKFNISLFLVTKK